MSVDSISQIIPSLKDGNAYSPLAKYECSYYSHEQDISPVRNLTTFTEVLVSTSILGSEILANTESETPFYCYCLPYLKYCQYETDVTIPILPFDSYESIGYFSPGVNFTFRKYIGESGYIYESLQIENPSLFSRLNDEFNEINANSTFVTLEVPSKTTVCVKYKELQEKDELEMIQFQRNSSERWNNEINLVLGIISFAFLRYLSFFESYNIYNMLISLAEGLILLYTLTDVLTFNTHMWYNSILNGLSFPLFAGFLCMYTIVIIFKSPVDDFFVRELINLTKKTSYEETYREVKGITKSIKRIFLLRCIDDLLKNSNVSVCFNDVYVYSTPRLLYLIQPYVHEQFKQSITESIVYWFIKIVFFFNGCLMLYFMISFFNQLRSVTVKNFATDMILTWIIGVFIFEVGLTITYHGYVNDLSHSFINKIYMFWSKIVFILGCLTYIFTNSFKTVGSFNLSYKGITDLEISGFDIESRQ